MKAPRSRKNKHGETVFYFQTLANGKWHYDHWQQPKDMDNKTAKDMALRLALDFKKKARELETTTCKNITFSTFAETWLEQSKCNDKSISYIERSKDIIADVNKYIGHKMLKALTKTDFVNLRYEINKRTYTLDRAFIQRPVKDLLNGKRICDVCRTLGMNDAIFFTSLTKGKAIKWETAERLCKETGINVYSIFMRDNKPRPWSFATKSKYKRLITTIIRQAVKDGIIDKNPIDDAFENKQFGKPTQIKKPLDVEEFTKLENALIHETHLRAKSAIAIMLYTGIRVGELTALRWEDINFRTGELSVNYSLGYVNKRVGYIEKVPKTPSSIRKIDMPQKLIKILLELKAEQDKDKALMGSLWVNKDKVITTPNGEWVASGVINVWLKDCVKRYGIRPISPHELRHTYATLRLRAGHSPRAVANALGHKDPSVTLDIYSHFIKEDMGLGANMFDSGVENILKPKNQNIITLERQAVGY